MMNNVLYTLDIVKNLIYVRQFAIDNHVSVEFDPRGFSLKDLQTGKIISHHNSNDALYAFTSLNTSRATLLSISSTFWHSRLGHPAGNIVDHLCLNSIISCNKSTINTHLLFHSNQISKQKRLPFFYYHFILYIVTFGHHQFQENLVTNTTWC